jgi:hypothetical protein
MKLLYRIWSYEILNAKIYVYIISFSNRSVTYQVLSNSTILKDIYFILVFLFNLGS